LIQSFENCGEQYHFGVHAYCVMPDHFHALVRGIALDSDLLLSQDFFKQMTSREYSKERGTSSGRRIFTIHSPAKGFT